MKKIITIYMLSLNLEGPAQQITTKTPFANTDYLKISRIQKTTAWTLLIGGTILTIAGMSTALQDVYLFSFDKESPNYKKGTLMFCAGGTAMLGSIPLFIIGAQNKKKAISSTLGFKMEMIQVERRASFTNNSYPALSLKLLIK